MTEPSEVATTVSHLRTILTLTAPFTAEDDAPELSGVWLEAGGGVLAATATDRYVMCHARTAAVGQWPHGVLVERGRAEALADALAMLGADDPITLTVLSDNPVGLQLTHPDAQVMLRCQDGLSGWIDYRKFFKAFGDEWTAEPGPVGMSGRIWAPFLAAAEVIGEPMRIQVVGTRKPVRVEIGDSFVGFAMPVALPGDQRSVPIGLPDARQEPAQDAAVRV